MYPRVGVLCGSGGIVGYGCWCDRHHLLIHPQHRATQPIVGHPSVHYSFSGYGAPSVRWRISWHISMVPWLGWVVIHLSYLCAGILVHVFRVTDGRSGDSNHHSKAPPHRYLNRDILLVLLISHQYTPILYPPLEYTNTIIIWYSTYLQSNTNLSTHLLLLIIHLITINLI